MFRLALELLLKFGVKTIVRKEEFLHLEVVRIDNSCCSSINMIRRSKSPCRSIGPESLNVGATLAVAVDWFFPVFTIRQNGRKPLPSKVRSNL
jgi:hypothetical protein